MRKRLWGLLGKCALVRKRHKWRENFSSVWMVVFWSGSWNSSSHLWWDRMMSSLWQSQKAKKGVEARWKECGSLAFCLDSQASQVAQMVTNLPAMQKIWVRSFYQEDPWRRAGQPTPIFLPGEFHRQRSLAGYCPWGHKQLDTTESDMTELDTTEPLTLSLSHFH